MDAICLLQKTLDGADMGFQFYFVAGARHHQVVGRVTVGEVHVDVGGGVGAEGRGGRGAVGGRVFGAGVATRKFGVCVGHAMGGAGRARRCGRAMDVGGRVEVLFEAAVGGGVNGRGAADEGAV